MAHSEQHVQRWLDSIREKDHSPELDRWADDGGARPPRTPYMIDYSEIEKRVLGWMSKDLPDFFYSTPGGGVYGDIKYGSTRTGRFYTGRMQDYQRQAMDAALRPGEVPAILLRSEEWIERENAMRRYCVTDVEATRRINAALFPAPVPRFLWLVHIKVFIRRLREGYSIRESWHFGEECVAQLRDRRQLRDYVKAMKKKGWSQ